MSRTNETSNVALPMDGLRQMLPFPIGAGVCVGTKPRPVWLEEEIDLASTVTETRRNDFRRGRAAARRALKDLGVPPEPIGRGTDRAPRWPAKVVGSIAHTDTIGAAIAAWRTDYRGLGLDLEARDRCLSQRATAHVTLPDELAWVRADPSEAFQRALLLFSAKESVFKAVYPTAHVRLNFRDAHFQWVGDRFAVTLLKACGPDLPIGFTLHAASRVPGEYLVTVAWF